MATVNAMTGHGICLLKGTQAFNICITPKANLLLRGQILKSVRIAVFSNQKTKFREF
jgi:hypothetical protein